MYLTIKETAEYLSMPLSDVQSLILQNKIRTVFDGEQHLINQDQFDTHLEQLERYKKEIAEWLSEPIPEDIDVKDED
ncbi:excisionase family DNA-binding protein [Terrilactibacillus sp. BCM23-1]|uniref:Excisionase family DNA-binding protein n=1 Tax=Terrilactibacillus tamarindi TaxID=2599694 RepID=A0A6N8CVE8_9BACI|nr:excisionase family DNA-binding protein [Terrilactibacillus tamarindi]MTT33215.1 excisionase family DNA-binding protein [Terrilactibacillus tamarindi]